MTCTSTKTCRDCGFKYKDSICACMYSECNICGSKNLEDPRWDYERGWWADQVEIPSLVFDNFIPLTDLAGGVSFWQIDEEENERFRKQMASYDRLNKIGRELYEFGRQNHRDKIYGQIRKELIKMGIDDKTDEQVIKDYKIRYWPEIVGFAPIQKVEEPTETTKFYMIEDVDEATNKMIRDFLLANNIALRATFPGFEAICKYTDGVREIIKQAEEN